MLAVHGVWAHRGALCLWAEPPGRLPLAGHDADALREALSGVAPRLAHALVARSRGTVELLLPTLEGRAVGSGGAEPPGAVLQGHRLPAVVLHPDRALDLLLEVARTEAAALPWPVSVGDDLRWLGSLAAAASARAGAGLLLPGLQQADGEWWGRWYPLLDRPWQRWSDAAAAAAPPSARAEVVGAGRGRAAQEVLEHLVAEVTALVGARAAVRAAGAPASSAPTPEPAGAPSAVAAWGEALRSADPVSAGVPARELADLAVRARAWRSSATTQPAELLLRIAEPPPGHDEDSDFDSDSDSDSPATTGPERTGWTLQVRLRSLDDPSTATTAAEARRGVSGEWGQEWDGELDPWAFALAELGRAAAVHPPLLELGAEPDADAPLTAQQVVDLVTDGVPALLDAGFAVALPGRWLRPAVGLSLRTRGVRAPGESDVPAAAGARGSLAQSDLVAVDWRVVLGDVELDERELALLAEQRAPLVQLRGQWVQVDQAALARSLRFLQRSAHQEASMTSLVGVLGQLASGSLPAPLVSLDGDGPLGALLAGGAGSWAEGSASVQPVPAPAGLRAVLRPYQERGVAWLAFLDAHGLGGVLADDMGLGKTIQLLALLLAERERAAASAGAAGRAPGPTLLVCPMSVVGGWEREAARFAPDLRVLVHHGPERLRGAALLAAAAEHDLVLTTYPLVARDTDDLAAVPWRRVALDEAQHVKNLGTRAARAVRHVAGPPHPGGGRTQRVALTGTPVENRLSELHAVLDFANPGVLGSAARFRERFSVPIEKHSDERATQLLTALSRPFVLRRAKTDPGVAPDLPAKLELVVRANLTTEQAALYKAVVDEMLAKVADADRRGGVERRGLVLATLTRLKQVCNHPAQLLADGSPFLRRGQHRSGKLALVDDVLDAVVADGEKALLFTQYRELGSMLVPHLRERYGVEVPFLHGGVARAARDAMVEQFSTAGSGAGDAGPPIMLLSLRAGGTGLNLVAANHVVHVDRWWNPAVEAQATDRAFRIGQTRQVQVRKLVCVGTVEERVDDLMARKAELASLVVGSGESWLTELSTSDLHDLLRLGAEAVGE